MPTSPPPPSTPPATPPPARRASPGASTPATANPRVARPGLWRRIGPWLLGLAALAALVAVFAPGFLDPASPRPSFEITGRLAMLPVVNEGAEGDAWVRWGLPMVVTRTLDQTSGVRTLSVRRLYALLTERDLDADDAAARHRAAELACAAGADVVVDARLRRAGDSVILAHRLVGSAGETIAAGEVRRATVLDAVAALTLSLAEPLAGGVAPVPMDRALSGDPFADRLYAEGVHRALVNDAGGVLPAYFQIALDNVPDFLHAKAAQIELLRLQGALRPARRQGQELLQEAQSRGARALQAEVFETLGLVAAMEGDETAAIEQYTQAHRLASQRRDRLGQAAALEARARVELAAGRSEEARRLLTQGLELRRGEGDRLGQVDVLLRLGSLLLAGGDLEAAAETLANGRALARDLDDAWGEHRVATSQGEVAWRLDDPVAAAEHWQAALAFYRQRGDRRRVLYLSHDLARATRRLGDRRAAEELYGDQLELARETGDERLEADACLRLAELELRQGYVFQAEDHLQCALEGDRHLGDRADLQRVIAWVAYEKGNYQLAFDTLSRVRRQSPDLWTERDEGFYGAYRLALASGRREPLPHEKE